MAITDGLDDTGEADAEVVGGSADQHQGIRVRGSDDHLPYYLLLGATSTMLIFFFSLQNFYFMPPLPLAEWPTRTYVKDTGGEEKENFYLR